MMKPSDSVQLMEANGRASELPPRNANFHNTQQAGYSAEKVYPTRSHTLDDNEMLLTNRTNGTFESNPMSPVRQRGIQYITEGDNTTAD